MQQQQRIIRGERKRINHENQPMYLIRQGNLILKHHGFLVLLFMVISQSWFLKQGQFQHRLSLSLPLSSLIPTPSLDLMFLDSSFLYG